MDRDHHEGPLNRRTFLAGTGAGALGALGIGGAAQAADAPSAAVTAAGRTETAADTVGRPRPSTSSTPSPAR